MGAIAAVVGFRRSVDSEHVVRQTDDYLVAQVRAGDELAFEAIYDRYAGGVLAFTACTCWGAETRRRMRCNSRSWPRIGRCGGG